MPDVRLNVTQAAERVGVTHPAILKAIRTGRLDRGEDGLVSATQVDQWNANRRAPRGGDPRCNRVTNRPHVTVTSSVAGDAARRAREELEATFAAGGLFVTRADAELCRDTFAAHSRRLKYEQSAGLLVETDEVHRAIAGACGKVRSRLLAIPTECAPSIARLRTVAEVEDSLREAITAALEALAEDFGEGAEAAGGFEDG